MWNSKPSEEIKVTNGDCEPPACAAGVLFVVYLTVILDERESPAVMERGAADWFVWNDFEESI